MKALESELKTLKDERQRTEADMANANETLLETQRTLRDVSGRRSELAAKIVPLQRLLNELAATRAAIDAQRQASEREIESVKLSHRELLAQINKETPEARRYAMQASIERVDTAIDELKQKVQELQRKIAEADARLAEGLKKQAIFEAGSRETLAQLRRLSGQIQTIRAQVSKFNVAAKGAVAGGRTSEAFYLTSELKQALDDLSQLTGTKKETELVERLDKQWRESREASADLTEKTAALEQLRRELASAERELQRKLQQRESDIKTAMTALESAEPAPREKSERPPRRKTTRRPKKTD